MRNFTMSHLPEWMAGAACASWDPELWFPHPGDSASMAKKVCSGCPVKEECLNYAVEHRGLGGIWGGLTEEDRRRKYPRT